MRMTDLLLLARRAFAGSKTRVLLAVLGVLIGSGTVVFVAGLIVSAEDALMNASEEANESDLIRVVHKHPPLVDEAKATRTLSGRDVEVLSRSKHLKDARISRMNMKQVEAHWHGTDRAVTVIGVEAHDLDLYRLVLASGRFLSESDQVNARRVAVLGHAIGRSFVAHASLGDPMITLDGVPFTVIGQLAHKPSLGASSSPWVWDQRVLIPLETFASIDGAPDDFEGETVFIRLPRTDRIAARIERMTAVVRSILLRRHLGIANFEVISDRLRASREALIAQVVELLLLGTGLIALLVGGINIMNVMLVTVRERTAEIGVRRALGATRHATLAQFLLEAAALGFVGGLGGVLHAIVLSKVVSLILGEFLVTWRFVVVPWSVVLAMLTATGTGVIFGLLPAWRAAALEPIEALRAD